MKNEQIKTIWLGIIAILGIFALVVQFLFYLHKPLESGAENIIRYFSYFTIQTNILIAVCTLSLLLRPRSTWGIFFSSAPVFTALTVYIIVVSLVYNILLRSLYHLEGLEKFANNLFHVVIPVMFVAYWIIYLPKKQLKWNVFKWLIYPLSYAGYILIRGAFSGYYPYPFLNVTKIGYPNVLTDLFFLLLLFLSLSLTLVAAAKLFLKHDARNRITK